MPRLATLRFHDLRHHAVTELAESLASDQTIMAIAGHVSPRMYAHNSHVRMEARRTALDALSTKRAESGNQAGFHRGCGGWRIYEGGGARTALQKATSIIAAGGLV